MSSGRGSWRREPRNTPLARALARSRARSLSRSRLSSSSRAYVSGDLKTATCLNRKVGAYFPHLPLARQVAAYTGTRARARVGAHASLGTRVLRAATASMPRSKSDVKPADGGKFVNKISRRDSRRNWRLRVSNAFRFTTR